MAEREAISADDEDRLREKLKRKVLIWEGAFGADTNGSLTEEGMDALFQFIRAEGYDLVRR